MLPRHKSDWERARAVVELGYPAVAPILPELLTWVQDMNWPIARILAPFLASIGEPLLPEVRRILMGDDVIWKYWIVQHVVAPSAALRAALAPELERFAALEPRDDDDEYLRDVAREALAPPPAPAEG